MSLREERKEHLAAIRSMDSELAELLARRTTPLVGRPRYSNESLKSVREALAELKKAEHPRDLTMILHVGLGRPDFHPKHLPALIPKLTEALLEARKASRSSAALPAVLATGISSGVFNSQNLLEVVPLFTTLAKRGHDPGEIAFHLRNGLEKKVIASDYDLWMLVAHAVREAKANPRELVTHALEANEQIKDMDKTIRFQVHILHKEGHFPTSKRVLEHWRKP